MPVLGYEACEAAGVRQVHRSSIPSPASNRGRGLALCLSLIAHAQGARAEERGSAQLRWVAPPECPLQAVILARIAEYTGTSAGASEPIQAEAQVDRTADGRYALHLRLTGLSGRADRALTTRSCEAAAQAAALLIAMAIDPKIADHEDTLADTPEAPAAPALQPSPVKSPLRPPTETTPTPAATHGPVVWGIGARALIDSGSFPGVNLGFAAQLEAKLGWLRLSLGGALFFPSEGPIAGLPTATVDISAVMAEARACAPLRMRGLELGPCALGELGELRGEAEGIRQSHPNSALWLAIGAALQSRLALGTHWAALADAGLAVPNARRRFLVLTDSGTLSVHRVAPAALRIGLGCSYEFN